VSLPPIIGLNGVARAGKDTVADILHQLYGYQPVSYSDVLNKALIALNPITLVYPPQHGVGVLVERYADVEAREGYEGAKERPEVRALLQRMGTEVGRNLLGEDIWVEALFKNIPWGFGRLIAVTNVRFPNEYDAVKARDGVVWRVDRPGYEPSQGHISDRALDDHSFDARLYNDGTIEELAQKVISTLSTPLQRSFATT
jgi:hypothetical protein